MFGALKGSAAQLISVAAAIAAGFFFSFTVGLALAVVPIALYIFNKIKIQIAKKQEKNIWFLKNKIEQIMKGKDNKNQNKKGLREK